VVDVAEEYRILHKREIPIGPGLPSEFQQVLVTYLAPGLPPFTLFFKKGEDSDAAVAQAIQESIKKRRAELA
jgi:hypothetical protein